MDVEKAEGSQKHLFIAATSDRGLCGAANSSIIKNIRTQLTEDKRKWSPLEINLVLVLDEHIQPIYSSPSMKSENDR